MAHLVFHSVQFVVADFVHNVVAVVELEELGLAHAVSAATTSTTTTK